MREAQTCHSAAVRAPVRASPPDCGLVLQEPDTPQSCAPLRRTRALRAVRGESPARDSSWSDLQREQRDREIIADGSRRRNRHTTRRACVRLEQTHRKWQSHTTGERGIIQHSSKTSRTQAPRSGRVPAVRVFANRQRRLTPEGVLALLVRACCGAMLARGLCCACLPAAAAEAAAANG